MDAKNKEQLDIISGWLDAIDPELPINDQVREEVEVGELLGELDDAEAFRIAQNALLARAKIRHPGFLEFSESPLTNQELIGLPASQLATGAEMLLKGKNPAAVVRADQYEDFERDILQPLEEVGGYHVVKTEAFPREGNGLGHSIVHLDNFIGESGKTDFRYGLSVSKVEQGQVTFVAGLAAKSVYGWDREQYEDAQIALNASKPISGVKDRATERTNPRGIGFKEGELSSKGVRHEMIATTLSAGDVAIWPQGADGAELPAWHGFFQVGNPKLPSFEPRESTSYHLGL